LQLWPQPGKEREQAERQHEGDQIEAQRGGSGLMVDILISPSPYSACAGVSGPPARTRPAVPSPNAGVLL
jgi:hypothetical protein